MKLVFTRYRVKEVVYEKGFWCIEDKLYNTTRKKEGFCSFGLLVTRVSGAIDNGRGDVSSQSYRYLQSCAQVFLVVVYCEHLTHYRPLRSASVASAISSEFWGAMLFLCCHGYELYSGVF